MTTKKDRKIIMGAIGVLSEYCSGTDEKIIDLLAGYLWDEQEANELKLDITTD